MHRPTAWLGAVVALSCAAPVLAQSAPVFTAEDMLAVRSFAGGQPVAVSPAGTWIAYVLTDTSDEWNVQALGGDRRGAPRALTTGAAHSSFPVWSPDGRRLAFVREEASGGRVILWD